MYGSGTRTTVPRWVSTSSASATCSSPACAPAQIPATPSCTSDAAFGIARTTGTCRASRSSIAAVGIAAAIESTVWSPSSRSPISSSNAPMSCGFTAITTGFAPATASPLERVASTPYRSESSSSRTRLRPVTTTSPAARQPELSSPERSASPILPPPRIASRAIRRVYERRPARYSSSAA